MKKIIVSMLCLMMVGCFAFNRDEVEGKSNVVNDIKDSSILNRWFDSQNGVMCYSIRQDNISCVKVK